MTAKVAGLVQMKDRSGNVAEWVADGFAPYAAAVVRDPLQRSAVTQVVGMPVCTQLASACDIRYCLVLHKP